MTTQTECDRLKSVIATMMAVLTGEAECVMASRDNCLNAQLREHLNRRLVRINAAIAKAEGVLS